jgi:hypothetical protein
MLLLCHFLDVLLQSMKSKLFHTYAGKCRARFPRFVKREWDVPKRERLQFRFPVFGLALRHF